jgi:hypothetical protein
MLYSIAASSTPLALANGVRSSLDCPSPLCSRHLEPLEPRQPLPFTTRNGVWNEGRETCGFPHRTAPGAQSSCSPMRPASSVRMLHVPQAPVEPGSPLFSGRVLPNPFRTGRLLVAVR